MPYLGLAVDVLFVNFRLEKYQNGYILRHLHKGDNKCAGSRNLLRQLGFDSELFKQLWLERFPITGNMFRVYFGVSANFLFLSIISCQNILYNHIVKLSYANQGLCRI